MLLLWTGCKANGNPAESSSPTLPASPSPVATSPSPEAVAVDEHPEWPVILKVPEGFTSNFSGSHEGTAVILEGAGGTVHIFVPNPEISDTGEASIIGERGLFASNGWETMEAGRQAQPRVDWASGTYPFFGADDLEGVVWLGEFEGREVRVIASAPKDKIDAFYGKIAAMVQGLKLRN